MHHFRKSFFIVFIFVSTFAYSQTGTLSGKVTSADNKPVAGATINIDKTFITVISNDAGIYTITKLKPGNYKVKVTAIGTEGITRDIRIQPGDNVLDFMLTQSSVELNEVVITGNTNKFTEKESEFVARMPISNLENPQVYSVVPKELMTEQLVTDYRSALSNAAGVSNVQMSFGGGGLGINGTMRGFVSGTATIRNGMNTNWLTMADPVNIERMEVIKGPSATLFGSSVISYGGLVNRVTKRPLDYFKGEVSYTVGSWNLNRVTADVNTPLNKDKTLLLRTNVAWNDNQTFQDYGLNKTRAVTAALTYIVSPKLKIDFELEHLDYKFNSTFYELLPNHKDYDWDFKKSYTSNDLLSSQKVTNFFAKASYIISPKWTSETYLSSAHTDFNTNYLFLSMIAPDAATPNIEDSLYRDITTVNGSIRSTQLQQNFTGNFNIGSIKNRLLIGLDYLNEYSDNLRWYTSYDMVKINGDPLNGEVPMLNYETHLQKIANTPVDLNYITKTETLSAYVSNVTNITDNLIAMLSLRYSYYHDKDPLYGVEQGALSQKLGLVYQVVPKSVAFFVNYMNGYLNNYPAVTRASAPGLARFKPEYANQLEGGVKLELLKGKVKGTISYYNILVDNIVRPDPVDDTYSIQDGSQRSKGFEVDVIASPVNGLNIIAGYGYNDNKYIKVWEEALSGKRPAGIPKHVGNFWISYRGTQGVLKGFGLGLGGNTQSDFFFDDYNEVLLDGFTTFDGSVFYESRKIRVGLKLNNITNQQYWASPRSAIPQPPRQLLGNITLKF
ncbi:MAG: TonB-dependent receptor [Chitinophagaceae bacterium]|nr:TonB-dependent receptor [Chitinophagaceae bacterium]